MATTRCLLPVLAAALVVMGAINMAVGSSSAQVFDDDLYQPRDPCPQVERIVKQAVDEEFRKNNQITAGLLRVFFHDCFTSGCDASILLDGEWDAGVNQNSVQPRVRQLVNEIRAKVNGECGDRSVSCADILALATRDSVAAAKGPNVRIPRGRMDSLRPVDTSVLPSPFDPIDDLLRLFARFGLTDAADLVALSGGHTVGRTKICGIVRDPFKPVCARNGNTQILDVITPNEFDNQYFLALTRSQGVFDSDQNLLSHPATQRFVRDFANNKQSFFNQWGVSFTKLSRTNWATSSNGEIRLDCTKPRTKTSAPLQPLSNIIDADQGFIN